MTLTIGVVTESASGERRVALDPSAVTKLVAAGRIVLVEQGAGTAASFPDAAYASAGASLVTRAKVLKGCEVLAVVRSPTVKLIAELRGGQLLIGMLDPRNNAEAVQAMNTARITAAAFELLPRTLSRAQSMDALSSQASAAGYRAAIVAAAAFNRYLPLMITAAGTATPAKVMVIGTGVAGLQAIATTKRLGAVVTGYDVRAASRGEVESLGASFLTSTVAAQRSVGGYAGVMSDEDLAHQQAELATALTAFDIIVTTAKVPGHTPPMLVSAETLASLKPGSVCVDLGSSPQGGNVAGSVEGTTITTANGVIVIGAGELASDLAGSASQMYARNVLAVLASLAPADEVVIDPADEVHAAIVVCHDGEISNPTIRTTLGLEPLETHAAVAS